jgi:hypothetical protein
VSRVVYVTFASVAASAWADTTLLELFCWAVGAEAAVAVAAVLLGLLELRLLNAVIVAAEASAYEVQALYRGVSVVAANSGRCCPDSCCWQLLILLLLNWW